MIARARALSAVMVFLGIFTRWRCDNDGEGFLLVHQRCKIESLEMPPRNDVDKKFFNDGFGLYPYLDDVWLFSGKLCV